MRQYFGLASRVMCDWFVVYVAALSALLITESRAGAVELRVGDVLTAGETFFDDGQNGGRPLAVLHIDPATRVHTYLSGSGVGVGPEFVYPTGIALQGNSEIFVADWTRILRVDPKTGDRAVLSGEGIGTGTSLISTHGLWLRDDHSLLVVDQLAKSVLSVDLTTGDRTVISSPTVGTGPELLTPYGVTTTQDGRILVASFGPRTDEYEYNAFVMAIDPATGNRSIFSDATHGGGPGYLSALGITRLSSGKILVTDNWLATISEIDPATGEQTLFHASSPEAPNDGQYTGPMGIAEGPDGTVYFTESTFGLMHIDTASGWARTLYSPNGTAAEGSYGITVVQVPEPRGLLWAALGSTTVAMLVWRRIRCAATEAAA